MMARRRLLHNLSNAETTSKLFSQLFLCYMPGINYLVDTNNIIILGWNFHGRIPYTRQSIKSKSRSNRRADQIEQPIESNSRSNRTADQIEQPIELNSRSNRTADHIEQPIILNSRSNRTADHIEQLIKLNSRQ
jgi:hypothetical protein